MCFIYTRGYVFLFFRIKRGKYIISLATSGKTIPDTKNEGVRTGRFPVGQ